MTPSELTKELGRTQQELFQAQREIEALRQLVGADKLFWYDRGKQASNPPQA